MILTPPRGPHNGQAVLPNERIFGTLGFETHPPRFATRHRGPVAHIPLDSRPPAAYPVGGRRKEDDP